MNLATYFMIAGAFVAVFAGMIGLYILTIFAAKFRPAVERKVKTTLDKAMYNKFIAGNQIAYLKTCIAFGVVLTTLDWNKSFGELQPELAPAYTLIILPVIYIVLMYRFSDRLE